MSIDQILNTIYLLPETAKGTPKACISEINYPKGHLLLLADKVEPKLYFIKQGIFWPYANAVDNEITFWFGKEGDTVISMKSYVANEWIQRYRAAGRLRIVRNESPGLTSAFR